MYRSLGSRFLLVVTNLFKRSYSLQREMCSQINPSLKKIQYIFTHALYHWVYAHKCQHSPCCEPLSDSLSQKSNLNYRLCRPHFPTSKMHLEIHLCHHHGFFFSEEARYIQTLLYSVLPVYIYYLFAKGYIIYLYKQCIPCISDLDIAGDSVDQLNLETANIMLPLESRNPFFLISVF